ncbi:MAG: tol-pal system-associated acyl-CoA thioesterase [Sphingobacteriia bacterium]|nr:tol-pal system-associated acyl-CoA thioesterase [Sphingobacteriia bacterium]NCC40632.1 tol-pal system-associated acyl-CoA thioesterase [Gammaproteobacteria bacterium]
MPRSNHLAPAVFDWPIRVYYEDTDAGGVVYHANYLAFLERSRTEWLRALGHEQDELRARQGILFAVRRLTLDYRAPARLNDRLLARSRLTRLGGATLEFAQGVIRETDQVCCCEGSVQVACIDATSLRPRRLPDDLMSQFKPLLSGPAEPAP